MKSTNTFRYILTSIDVNMERIQDRVELAIFRENELGLLPSLTLVAAFALFLIGLSFAAEMIQAPWAALIFWVGLLAMLIPFGLRLASRSATRIERIGLVIVLAMTLYLVKVIHSPFAFTFSDELLHYFNAENIAQTGKLFIVNPILPSSVSYPGLEIMTSMLSGVTGLSLFHSGLVVIGVSRLILAAALFLFFEKISQSSRTAGLAALLYMANPNFLYWSAQFAYESMALPLGVLIVYSLAARFDEQDKRRRLALLLAMIGLIFAVVVSHHMTSFVLAGFLFTLALIFALFKKQVQDRKSDALVLAVLVLALSIGWLLLAGQPTQIYLSNIFSAALRSLRSTLAGMGGRAPFQSTGGVVAPLWERITGLASVALSLLATPIGLFDLWRRRPLRALVWMMIGACLAYFGMLWLRLVPAAWEISNRASEFLFIGLAFVLATAFMALINRYPGSLRLKAGFACFWAVFFVGGLIVGWPPQVRLAKPYLATTGSTIIQPQGKTAAQWMLNTFGPDNSVATAKADALFMLADGMQSAISSNIYDVGDLLQSYHPQVSRLNVVGIYRLEFIVFDTRYLGWDNMAGGYLDPAQDQGALPMKQFDQKTLTMFEGDPGEQRVYDSGNIVIYDVRNYTNAAKIK